MIKGRGYETGNPRDAKEEHKNVSKEDATDDAAVEEMGKFFRFLRVHM